MKPRHFLIRFLTPLVWRFSEKRKIEALQLFSLVEKDSGCQILSVIGLVNDPRGRALLFQQAIEEFRHHDLFQGACLSLATAPLGIPVMARNDLVDSASGTEAVLEFLAYLHVSEREVNTDFEVYEKIRTDEKIIEVFKEIRADEMRHESDSLGLLRKFASSDEGRLRRALFKSSAIRSYRSCLRALRHLGEIPLSLLLGVLYFLAGPLVFRIFQRRLELAPDEQLGIVLEQWRAVGGRA